MRFWISEFQTHFFLIASGLFLLSLLSSSFTTAQAIGGLVLFGAVQAKAVTEYLYPKRPDLYKDVEELRALTKEVKTKAESIETDVTALKFGALRK